MKNTKIIVTVLTLIQVVVACKQSINDDLINNINNSRIDNRSTNLLEQNTNQVVINSNKERAEIKAYGFPKIKGDGIFSLKCKIKDLSHKYNKISTDLTLSRKDKALEIKGIREQRNKLQKEYKVKIDSLNNQKEKYWSKKYSFPSLEKYQRKSANWFFWKPRNSHGRAYPNFYTKELRGFISPNDKNDVRYGIDTDLVFSHGSYLTHSYINCQEEGDGLWIANFLGFVFKGNDYPAIYKCRINLEVWSDFTEMADDAEGLQLYAIFHSGQFPEEVSLLWFDHKIISRSQITGWNYAQETIDLEFFYYGAPEPMIGLITSTMLDASEGEVEMFSHWKVSMEYSIIRRFTSERIITSEGLFQ